MRFCRLARPVLRQESGGAPADLADKVRTHGVGKRRTWRKLHVGVNEATGLKQFLGAAVALKK